MFQSARNPDQQPDPFNPNQRQILDQANQLLAQGKPGGAAILFAEIAEVVKPNYPQRAANLHAQAAHAFADDHQGQSALIQARAALNLFIKNKMVQRTPVFYANITRKLNNKGMENIANVLVSEFGSRIGPLSQTPTVPGTQKHGLLPTNCPKCGGPIHGEEAKWVDAKTAECEYCGSLIRPE